MIALPPAPLALVPTGLLRWFDDDPVRYWTLAWIAWGALVLVTLLGLFAEWNPTHSFARRLPRWIAHPAIFAVLAVVAMLACRWPMVFAGPLMNPDENQHGAAAMTYWRDPIPWRSVDLHTSGPINAYALWPSMLINGRVDYAELRLTALFAHIAAALACFGFFRRFTSESVARVAALPLISFAAFCAFWEFVQYSSEQVSTCILAVAAWLLAVGCTLGAERERGRRWSFFLAGFGLGSLPFAKMQSVPLGIAVGVFGLVAVLLVPAVSRRQRISRALSLLGGALVTPVLIASALTIYGLWAQFRASYFESNVTYLGGYDEARTKMLREFFITFVTYTDGFVPFFWGTLGFAAGAALITGVIRLRPRALLAAAWILVIIGIGTVVYPGRPFGHYLHFLLLPLAWLSGLTLVAVLRHAQSSGAARWWVVGIFAAITLVPQVATRAREPHPAVGKLVQARADSLHPVSARLRELAQPGDTMMVWGWFPRLYTESGIPQGTREAHTYHEIESSPMIRFFRDRTLRDLRKNQPALFVDSVCEGSFTY
ncbi:MAG: hypothetical protein JWM35_1157, partial [Verrucomicrobia bacterium]|nr:hypothetical protein [Verrucomicrobiota bacterium]